MRGPGVLDSADAELVGSGMTADAPSRFREGLGGAQIQAIEKKAQELIAMKATLSTGQCCQG